MILGQHQPLASWFGHGIAEVIGGVDPKLDCFIRVSEGKLVSISVRHAARKLWDFDNVNLIFITPVDSDLVLVHQGLFIH